MHFVNRATLDQLHPGTSRHQGIAAERAGEQLLDLHDLKTLVDQAGNQTLVLVLDGIKDPHNLGACLRTADATGVTAVVICKDKAVGLTPTVRKVAVGAAETVPLVQVTNLRRALDTLKQHGIWIYGTSDRAEASLYQQQLTGPIAIVMGSEDKGLRRLTAEHCDILVKLPMQGTVSSLNISVATGVCLYEVIRQRSLN